MVAEAARAKATLGAERATESTIASLEAKNEIITAKEETIRLLQIKLFIFLSFFLNFFFFFFRREYGASIFQTFFNFYLFLDRRNHRRKQNKKQIFKKKLNIIKKKFEILMIKE